MEMLGKTLHISI